MTADIHAELLGWVLDELDRVRLGEAYGAAVSLTPAMIGPGQTVPVWMLLITARNPMLTEGPLFHFVPLPGPLPGPRPGEEAVRAAVADGVRQLRDLMSRKLAGGNGHAPAGLVR
jgi:hypothetical protein